MASERKIADREYPHDREPASADEISRSERGADFFARHGAEAPRPIGRPKSEHPKRQVTLRLDADIIERVKADGKGWQTRLNDTLREALGL